MDLNIKKNSIGLLLFLLIVGCGKVQNSNHLDQSDTQNRCLEKNYTLKDKEVINSFKEQLKEWKETRFFNNPVLLEQQIDSSIFYNQSEDHFFLGVLQKWDNGEVFDGVRVIMGTKCNERVLFSIGMQITFKRNNKNITRSFDKLKKEYIDYVYRQGKSDTQCTIDYNYWFAANVSYPDCNIDTL